MQVAIVGTMNGVRHQRRVNTYYEENYVAAVAPVLVCQQLVDGTMTEYGAFVPPQIVPAHDVLERLKRFDAGEHHV